MDTTVQKFELKNTNGTWEKYTWHHLDDFNPITGECTMQLVESSAHQGTGVVGMSHSGSVAQWKAYYVSSANAPNGLFYQQ